MLCLRGSSSPISNYKRGRPLLEERAVNSWLAPAESLSSGGGAYGSGNFFLYLPSDSCFFFFCTTKHLFDARGRRGAVWLKIRNASTINLREFMEYSRRRPMRSRVNSYDRNRSANATGNQFDTTPILLGTINPFYRIA